MTTGRPAGIKMVTPNLLFIANNKFFGVHLLYVWWNYNQFSYFLSMTVKDNSREMESEYLRFYIKIKERMELAVGIVPLLSASYYQSEA